MAGRVPIPAGVRRTIQDIKEIAGNFSDEEVYAVLRDCAMDPNETAQKLLLEDTFHEVKRKRDKKKETNKEITDLRWRSGMQGRGGKLSRGIYSSRSNDVGGRSGNFIKENGLGPQPEKANGYSLPVANAQTDAYRASYRASSLVNGQPHGNVPIIEAEDKTIDKTKTTSSQLPDVEAINPGDPATKTSVEIPHTPELSSLSAAHAYLSFECSPMQPQDAGTSVDGPVNNVNEQHHIIDFISPSERDSREFGRSSKAASKEWKPKASSASIHSREDFTDHVDVSVDGGNVAYSGLEEKLVTSGDSALKAEKNSNELQLLDRQCVIIPNHLQVSDSVKCGLSFGSFESSFELTKGSGTNISSPLMELSLDDDEYVEEPISDQINSVATHNEITHAEHQQASVHSPEKDTADHVELYGPSEKVEPAQPEETSLASEVFVCSAVQTAPLYPTLEPTASTGNHYANLDPSEPSAQDNNQHQNVVQPPLDLSGSFYTQLFRSTAETDGHLSPFLAPGAIKYGNISVLPVQNSQTQEGSNPLVIPSSGSTFTTQSTGAQCSVAIPQQPLHMFRQAPVGMPMSHHPPSYIPYSHYIPPFYVPPPALHHYLSNASFPQQALSAGIYPVIGSAAVAPPVKSSTAQLKPGATVGSQVHVGVPGNYATYAPNPTSDSAVASNDLGENSDGVASQFKDSSAYISGQQSDGPYVWISGPGRDVSGLQTSSFYGFHPQGQQMTFAPAQAGHGVYGGVYHPAQTVSAAAAVHQLLQPPHTMAAAVEMAGPPPNTYQQAQRAQINWSNNY